MDKQPAGAGRPAALTGLSGRFIRLREDKAPVSWDMSDEVTSPNLGIVIPEPYVVIDIDDAREADKLIRLLTGRGIKAQIMRTTRGAHFWFASAEPQKNSVRSMTGIGLTADYRSWGKQSQVCVKLRGEWREWLTGFSWDEIDELPKWIRPLRHQFKFCGMREGDGRNQALFTYQIELAKRGWEKDESFALLRLINEFIFDEPLPGDEINLICRDDAYPKSDNLGADESTNAPWFGENNKFLHNIMGDTLIAEKNIISYRSQLYTFAEGCYRPGENDILRSIIDKYPTSKRTQQNEVLNYLNIQQHIDKPDMDEYIINVKNGRLDLLSGELREHTPDAVDFQQINALYDPARYYAPLDDMLRRVFCYDEQLYMLFEEMLGYCLVKNCRMQKIFIFFGDGNNGKSTLLRLIHTFIGSGNYSTLSIQDLEKNFRPAELADKLVNVGDDIPPTTINDSSILKSISTGEPITVERKNKDPFNLVNYATLIFTTNKMPLVNDKSFGFYRRLILIPLDAAFSKQDKDYDPDIAAKLSAPESMSYMLNMAVRGLRRLMRRGFTESDKVRAAVDTYKTLSSHTLTWLSENGIEEEYILAKHTGELYYEFKNWCESEGIENVPKQRIFTDDIKKRYGFKVSDLVKVQNKPVRYFTER